MKESPGPPQNFSRIIWLSGIGTVARFRAFLIFLSRRLQGGWRAALRCPAGACLFGCPPTLPLVLILPPSPHPPTPLPGGKGEIFSFFYARGFAPCIPGAEPGRHRLSLPSRYPVQGEPEVRRKNDRTAFLLAVPAAKERGDRGRWNYPSHATAAFEMVLSPGAGRTSAAWGRHTPSPKIPPVPQMEILKKSYNL